ncbi:MAG: bifunctional diguanylate cyclase/phosphodiesterase [Alphaproteobacteria bacterium]|nr:bifunctional diguanylate cyclase/phosphodiesterase [Alphaproteobacteria bacterium]
MLRDIARSLKSRLGRRVGVTVLLLILGVEIAIFIPSALRLREDMIGALEERVRAVADAALDGGSPVGTTAGDRAARLAAHLVRQEGVRGAAVFRSGGAGAARAGEPVETTEETAPSAIGAVQPERRVTSDGAHYELVWRTGATGEPLLVVARTDRQTLSASLAYFALRVGGLVSIIIVVVTVGVMLSLHRLVLRPVLALHRSMRAATADPDNADSYLLGMPPTRRDELADVLTAHDAMLARVAESKRADRARAEDRALWLSRHEPLTALPNRAYLAEILGRAVAQAARARQGLAVLTIDIARFRSVNDGYGASAGDAALREVARRLLSAVRPGDAVARIGGDIFAVVMASPAEPGGAAAAARRMLDLIEKPFAIEGADLALRGRVGISIHPDDGADAAALLQAAEMALAGAKREAIGTIRFASAAMTLEARRRQRIESELGRAIERGELELFYQPKLSLGANPALDRLSGAEALIRWRHPERGLVSPGEFIPVAEASGQIIAIGLWAIEQACWQVARWDREGLSAPRVAVNISAQQFRDPHLPAHVARAMADAGIGADRIELEITETTAMSDVESAAATIAALKMLGVTLSIDDFGTGYSSLSYLRRFAIDAIKLDQSFVRPLGDGANDQAAGSARGGVGDHAAVETEASRERGHAEAISEAVLGLGRSLGKKVIAEGVERADQLDYLRTSGCDEVQGYLVGRPVPALEFGEILRAGLKRAA